MKNTRKILVALFLMLTLVVGMAAVTASAEEGYTTVYFQPTTGDGSWDAYCEGYAAYYWTDAADGWVIMTEVDAETSIHKADVPSGATGLIFVSLKSLAAGGSWDNKDSQTVDLTVPTDSNNLFVLQVSWNGDYEWKGTGAWTTYGGSTEGGDSSDDTTEGGDSTEGGTTDTPIEGAIQPDEFGYYTVYLYDTASWEFVYYHCWNNNGSAAEWPGLEMTWENNYLYSCKISTDYTGFLFTNSEGSVQSDDMSFATISADKVVYDNANKTWMSLDDYDPDAEILPPEDDVVEYDEYVRVYFGNSANWESVCVYSWMDGTETALKAWPGTEVTDYDSDTGLYYVDIPTVFDRIIFNNGTGGAGNQTEDLYLPSVDSTKIVCDGAENIKGSGVTTGWYTIEEYQPAEYDPIENLDYEVTVALKNDAGWEEVYYYYFDISYVEGVVWPGAAMTLADDGYYYAVIPADNRYVIFNNGGNWEIEGDLLQTADLLIPEDSYILFNNATNEWSFHTIPDFGGGDETPDGGDETPDGGDETPDGGDEIPDGGDETPDAGETPDGGDETPDEQPEEELGFFEAIWKAICDFFASIGDFFAGLFGGAPAEE